MLSIGPERLSDIWDLNHKFLSLFGNQQSFAAMGLPEDLRLEVGKLSAAELTEVSKTDMLLFSVSEFSSCQINPTLPDEVKEFFRQMGLTFRDISQEDLGVAAAKLGLAKEQCEKILRLRLADARNHYVNYPPMVVPIGTTQFRVLTGLHSQSDRTQYALLAANDD